MICFRLRDVPRMDVYSAIPALRTEACEACGNPLTQLPGSGPKQDCAAQAGSAPVSPMLRDIIRDTTSSSRPDTRRSSKRRANTPTSLRRR